MRLALFGGSFNPPGLHHRQIAEALAKRFDEVIVIPCGPRPDKPITNDVDPIHRAALADLTFAGLPRVRVELFDLEANTFTRTSDLDQQYAAQGEVWHVVGADLIAGGRHGRSPIQQHWRRGAELWRDARFAVLTRPGYALEREDLPPHAEVFETDFPGASTSIREQAFKRQDLDKLLTPAATAYIERYGLYRGIPPVGRTQLTVERPRLLIVADDTNPKAREAAEHLGASTTGHPDLIVVVGGDGAMLRAIRQHWRLRVPFYGVNAGHLGFLLNETPPPLAGELLVHHLPLLWAETINLSGHRRQALAFNDCWVERATGQTAWIRVDVNGQVRLERLVADGALVSSAAGSASYARAMGATPLPLGTPAILLVGSNVLAPDNWRPVVLPRECEVTLTTLDPAKRPLRGYVDGVLHGEIESMLVRNSRTAAVELAFDPKHDPAEKLARIQFPR